MKKFLYLSLICCQFLSAQPLFDKANTFYRSEKYVEAAKAYEEILASGKFSAEVYFNLGNTYYKLGKVAPAVYNYEMALLLKPGDEDIKNNLTFAEQLRIDDIKEVGEAGFAVLLADTFKGWNHNSWAKIAVVFMLLACVGIGFYYFGSRRLVRKLSFIFASFAFLLGIVAGGFAQLSFTSSNSKREAVVFAENLPVKSEPKAQSADAFSIHAGTKVRILETLDRWFHIQLQNGNEGWVLASEVKEIRRQR
ncbi:tetratricopeptide repeat protein [Flavobacterium sp.]|uniref:tetratricopeptide repeat protein n=1 Tax=Flavobacterium sp. TaxID=239 RepID=UPI003B9CB94B